MGAVTGALGGMGGAELAKAGSKAAQKVGSVIYTLATEFADDAGNIMKQTHKEEDREKIKTDIQTQLGSARQLIQASRSAIGKAQTMIAFLEKFATSADASLTKADQAGQAFLEIEAPVSEAKQACDETPSLSDVQDARDKAVKGAREVRQRKQGIKNMSDEACFLADFAASQTDPDIIKHKITQAKLFAKQALDSAGHAESAQKASKEAAELAITHQKKRESTKDKVAQAIVALDKVNDRIIQTKDEIVRDKAHYENNKDFAQRALEVHIKKAQDSKNGALSILNRVNQTAIHLKTWDRSEIQGKGGNLKDLINQTVNIKIPSSEEIKRRIKNAAKKFFEALEKIYENLNRIEELRRSLEPCRNLEEVEDLVKEAMGASEAALRDMNLIVDMATRAVKCAGTRIRSIKPPNTGFSSGVPPPTTSIAPKKAPWDGIWYVVSRSDPKALADLKWFEIRQESAGALNVRYTTKNGKNTLLTYKLSGRTAKCSVYFFIGTRHDTLVLSEDGTKINMSYRPEMYLSDPVTGAKDTRIRRLVLRKRN